MIAWDFVGPDVEHDEVRESVQIKRKKFLKSALDLPHLLRHRTSTSARSDPEKAGAHAEIEPTSTPELQSSVPLHPTSDRRHVSFMDEETGATTPDYYPSRLPTPSNSIVVTPITSPDPTIAHADTMTFVDSSTVIRENEISEKHDASSQSSSSRPGSTSALRHKLSKRIKPFLSSLPLPPSISIIISFTIALVTPLKALFVPIPSSHIPNAPDGQPPLAFIQDAATFIGAASVPLGLMCLGSALARLKVPRNEWGSLPIGAITSLAVAKILITPVLGVLICQGLTMAGVIDPDDKVLRFVCM